jgi:class 3 adenylate cyclase
VPTESELDMSNKVTRALARARNRDAGPDQGADIEQLKREVAQLQSAVEESRRLNERLSDVLDVVVELLVPAVDRNDERLESALKKL